jgi:hypothetical protein
MRDGSNNRGAFSPNQGGCGRRTKPESRRNGGHFPWGIAAKRWFCIPPFGSRVFRLNPFTVYKHENQK